MTAASLDLPLVASGKVREIYDLGDRLLLVASDRISTYDVVHPNGIPDKGKVLTGISAFWFNKTGHIVPNHYISATEGVPAEVRGRAMAVTKLNMLPVECVVRGYITGSGWKDYQSSGRVSGIELPAGLRESQKLPTPIFTPSTKAETGHDENISESRMREIVGSEATTNLRNTALALYHDAEVYARGRGIIIADTKFEFGLDPEGRILLIDEVLTPDSSRFWPASTYEPGHSQPSFDKQFVRDYLETLDWDKRPPAPPLPTEVAAATTDRYLEAYRLLTGRQL